MFFNSIPYAFFLPVVFMLYWYVFNKSVRVQNHFLITCSYFFYACWSWKFLFLLLFSTLLDFATGLQIHNATSARVKKAWLTASISVNLGFLFFFKYFHFFSQPFAFLIQSAGIKTSFSTLDIILPVGISFYTFHGISYLLDIYRGKITPTKNLVDYALFVSFFPLLVAGPIERATHLLPQVEQPRKFNHYNAVDGLKQILWGLFKKVVIANNCAELSNLIFNNATDYSGATLLLGALFFTFQIYGDFSGYSDIAIGSARLLGFDLLQNFKFPYFSRDMAEFWRRWHISLSSWFKDYLYIPLGGSKAGTLKKVRNTFIIFLVSGLWHGANYTFIAWGALNALYILPLIVFKKNRENLEIVAKGKGFPTIKEAAQMIGTFCLTVFAWIFFRAKSIADAFSFIKSLVSGLFSASAYAATAHFFVAKVGVVLPVLILAFMVVEWLGRENKYAIEGIAVYQPKIIRWSFYCGLAIAIFLFTGTNARFIYFQF